MSPKTNKLLATFFCIGDIPLAPGTAASLAGLLIYIILFDHPVFYLIFGVGVTLIGFKVSGEVEKQLKTKDPSCIVIDEVAGILIAVFLLPLNASVLVTAFFLFRAFDMFKIYPVNKLEAMPGSAGIMMDDLVAGLYTCLIMHVAIRWAGIF